MKSKNRRRISAIAIALAAIIGGTTGAFAVATPSQPGVAGDTNEIVADAPIDDGGAPLQHAMLADYVANTEAVPAMRVLEPAPVETVAQVEFTDDMSLMPTVNATTSHLQTIDMELTDEYVATFAEEVAALNTSRAGLGVESRGSTGPTGPTGRLLVVDSLAGLKAAEMNGDIKLDAYEQLRSEDAGLAPYATLDEVPEELLTLAIDPIVINTDMLFIAEESARLEAMQADSTAVAKFSGGVCRWDDTRRKEGSLTVDSDQIKGSDGQKYSPQIVFNESNDNWSVKASLIGYFKGTANYEVAYGVKKCFGVPVWARMNNAEFTAKATLGVQGMIEAKAHLKAEKVFSKQFVTPPLGYAVDAGIFRFGLYAAAKLEVGIKLEASIEAELNARVNLEGDAEWTFVCPPGDRCQQVGDAKQQPFKLFIDPQSQASLKAKLVATPFIDAMVEAGASVEVANRWSFGLLTAGAGANVSLPISLTVVACLADLDGDMSPELSTGVFVDVSFDLYIYWRWSLVGKVNFGEIHIFPALTKEAKRLAEQDPTGLSRHLAKKIDGWTTVKLQASTNAGGGNTFAIRRSLFSRAIGEFSLKALRPIVRQTNKGISVLPQACYPFGSSEPLYTVEINGSPIKQNQAPGHFDMLFVEADLPAVVSVRQTNDTMGRNMVSPPVVVDARPSSEVRTTPEEVATAPETTASRNMKVSVQIRRQPGHLIRVRATVTVKTPSGAPIANAAVTGEWTEIDGTTSKPVTDAAGVATFEAVDDGDEDGRSVIFTVSKVEAPDHKVFQKNIESVLHLEGGSSGSTGDGDTCTAITGGQGRSVRPLNFEGCADFDEAARPKLSLSGELRWECVAVCWKFDGIIAKVWWTEGEDAQFRWGTLKDANGQLTADYGAQAKITAAMTAGTPPNGAIPFTFTCKWPNPMGTAEVGVALKMWTNGAIEFQFFFAVGMTLSSVAFGHFGLFTGPCKDQTKVANGFDMPVEQLVKSMTESISNRIKP